MSGGSARAWPYVPFFRLVKAVTNPSFMLRASYAHALERTNGRTTSFALAFSACPRSVGLETYLTPEKAAG